MAIDDNKLYNLKGSQLKDLAEKVKNAGKAFVATYNVTTAAELAAYLDSTKEPFAPILVKRGNDYYTAILATKSNDSVIVRVIGSGSGDYYIFNYTVTGNTWASSSYGFQKKLVSGIDIKTINNESLLGSGNIDVSADLTDYYNKTETDALLDDKADADTTYTKTEVDTALATKADTATTYTKTEVDTALSAKADAATTYTKTEVDDLVDAKEDAGVVFNANTDYSYATMSNALGKGLVYVTTDGTNRILVTHTSVVDSERDITLYAESSSGTYTGQLAFRWIDGEAQPMVREYVLPTGGTTGQVLAKRSNVTGDVQWVDAAGSAFVIDTTNPCSYNELYPVLYSSRPIYVKDGSVYRLVEDFDIYNESEHYYITLTTLGTIPRNYLFDADTWSLDQPMTFVSVTNKTYGADMFAQASSTGLQNSVRFIQGTGSDAPELIINQSGKPHSVTMYMKKGNNTFATFELPFYQNFELCVGDTGGNVVQTGSITIDNVQYGIFEFYYKTSALANTGVLTYPFANLLANYSIKDFIDATGITSNGIFIGNGRTDNDNRLIVQQFSKNSKNIQIRTYKDFSGETATIKVKFIGTKNS